VSQVGIGTTERLYNLSPPPRYRQLTVLGARSRIF